MPMTKRDLANRLIRGAGWLVFPGVPVMLLMVFVLVLVSLLIAVTTNQLADYWDSVPLVWLTVLLSVAVVGIFGKYWIPRLIWGRKQIFGELIEFVYAGAVTPIAFILVTLLWVDSPIWLYVLCALSLVLGFGGLIDASLYKPPTRKRFGRISRAD